MEKEICKMTDFSRNLSAKRIQNGISQKAMAEAIGVAQPTYSLYEKGAREPNISKIVKIAEVLAVSVDELFGVNSVNDSLFDMINKLDPGDRGEIVGMVKQMLKSDKYKEEK